MRAHIASNPGSVFAVERSQAFTGPGRDVLAERDEAGA